MQTLGIKATRTAQNKAGKFRIMKQMNKCGYVCISKAIRNSYNNACA